MPLNVLIIGLGLIGGSLGLALRQSPLVDQIIGYDIDKDNIRRALEIGAIDCDSELPAGVKNADIIILCTPLSCFESILISIKPHLRPGTIVTDTGSTKQRVMNMFTEILPEQVWGIGGHPMAGSEIKGIKGADRYLFENAVYVITPSNDTPEDAADILLNLFASTGARMKTMAANQHDHLVATISHIPHVAAVSLVNLTKGDNDCLMMAAGGFRDTTRIASSDSAIWEDILLFNRDQVLIQLEELTLNLDNIKRALETEDRAAIRNMLKTAKDIRDKIPAIRKGLLPGFSDLICIVPDKPGIIGKIGALLGKHDINIVDIEILRAREGDGGTMRIGVPSADDAGKAVNILESMGIKAWTR